MEENKEGLIESNNDNVENKKENVNVNNIDELPEPEISEEELKDIITYINTWDFEKYQRDLEVREALLLLRNKMKQEEEEKQKKFNELKRKETINKNNNENQNISEEEEKKIEGENNLEINNINVNNNNDDVFKNDLSEQEKQFLEKNWNNSTKPELGERIVNEKGDKEIIINNNDKKVKKVNIFLII